MLPFLGVTEIFEKNMYVLLKRFFPFLLFFIIHIGFPCTNYKHSFMTYKLNKFKTDVGVPSFQERTLCLVKKKKKI